MAEALFQTQRTRILKIFQDAGMPFLANTKPYKSTLQVEFNFVDGQQGPPATMGMLVAKKGQILEFFGYKIGDAIPYGLIANSETRRALEDDTNVSRARQTNGVEDFVIEGMSCTNRGYRVAYAAGTYTGTDPSAVAAHLGHAAIYDPGALSAPPQVGSPFNLENALWEAIKPCMQIEFEWDRSRIEKVGTLDEIPEGGAKSALKASGDPRTDNRYRIPEGYIWRREGEPDSEFIARATLSEDVVVPVSTVALNGGATLAPPVAVWLDITLRLHGLSVKLPSKN